MVAGSTLDLGLESLDPSGLSGLCSLNVWSKYTPSISKGNYEKRRIILLVDRYLMTGFLLLFDRYMILFIF